MNENKDNSNHINNNTAICIIVEINSKKYTVYPPTIAVLSGAMPHLSEAKDAETIRGVLLSLEDSDKCAKALSWFIAGDESLFPELSKGTYDEIIDALEKCISMIKAKSLLKAASLIRNISLLVARPRKNN